MEGGVIIQNLRNGNIEQDLFSSAVNCRPFTRGSEGGRDHVIPTNFLTFQDQKCEYKLNGQFLD